MIDHVSEIVKVRVVFQQRLRNPKGNVDVLKYQPGNDLLPLQ